MRGNILPFQAIVKQEISQTQILQRRRTLWTAASVGSLLLGFALIGGGLILSLTAYLERYADNKLNSHIGNLMLMAAFPVFFLAAHSLDKIELVKQAEKIEMARRHDFYK